MDIKIVFSTFIMIFLAEFGDKTQLLTFSYAAKMNAPISVFAGATLALTLTSLIAVVFGEAVTRLIPHGYIKFGAGMLFIIFGVWMIFER